MLGAFSVEEEDVQFFTLVGCEGRNISKNSDFFYCSYHCDHDYWCEYCTRRGLHARIVKSHEEVGSSLNAGRAGEGKIMTGRSYNGVHLFRVKCSCCHRVIVCD